MTPTILTLSNSVWPSTSKSLKARKLPCDLTIPLDSMVNLSALFVWSLISNVPLLFKTLYWWLWLVSSRIITGLPPSILTVFPVTFRTPSTKVLPAKVDTPDTFTLSKFVWPSTSKSRVNYFDPEKVY